MQPYEIIGIFNNVAAAAKQSNTRPLTEQALALLTLGCVLDDRLSNIERELEELKIRL